MSSMPYLLFTLTLSMKCYIRIIIHCNSPCIIVFCFSYTSLSVSCWTCMLCSSSQVLSHHGTQLVLYLGSHHISKVGLFQSCYWFVALSSCSFWLLGWWLVCQHTVNFKVQCLSVRCKQYAIIIMFIIIDCWCEYVDTCCIPDDGAILTVTFRISQHLRCHKIHPFLSIGALNLCICFICEFGTSPPWNCLSSVSLYSIHI